MGNVHFDSGKLDALMGVERIRLTPVEVVIAAGAAFGREVMFPARFQQLLPVSFVAFLAAFGSLFLFLFSGSSFKGAVR